MENKLDDQNSIFKTAFCSLLLFFFMGISILPSSLVFFKYGYPMLLIAALYYWGVFRVGFLSPAFVFTLGLVYDCFSIHAFGSSSLVFLGVFVGVRAHVHFLLQQSFLILWSIYSVIVLAANAIFYTLDSVFSLSLMPLSGYMMDVMISVLLFPCISFILSWTNSKEIEDAPLNESPLI